MTETRFTLNNNASNGTSNLSYLLTGKHVEAIRSLTPVLLENEFGPGDEALYEPSRGYTDPEWYWEASNGSVWGIAWRWGSPRLRGRGGKQSNQDGPFWVHPKEEDAAEFIEFLVEQLAPNGA
tara:strand:+ start:622 stop:990 length:369 start_codon:yes stop_codon:yes gene_type:complete